MKNANYQAKSSNFSFSKIATGLALATALISGSVAADDRSNVSGKTTAKSAGIFTAATIVGGVVAGPVGFIVGALSGAYLGEQTVKLELEEDKLASTEASLAAVRQQSQSQQQEIATLVNNAAQPLEFLVFFPTGDDKLSHRDNQRITSLANYMKDNPKLKIRLDGYADPRGTDEYNNVLSEERARSVVAALTKRGIAEERIEYHAHGSNLSSADIGDLEAYALERKVRIEVFAPVSEPEFAVY